MADFWFFPSCNNNKTKDIFVNVDYKKGISFKLPLTGTLYSKISESFQYIALEEGSFFKNVWYVPVSIDFEKTTQSLSHSPENNKNLTFNLKLKGKQLVLSYFVTHEISINQIEPIL